MWALGLHRLERIQLSVLNVSSTKDDAHTAPTQRIQDFIRTDLGSRYDGEGIQAALYRFIKAEVRSILRAHQSASRGLCRKAIRCQGNLQLGEHCSMLTRWRANQSMLNWKQLGKGLQRVHAL